MTPDWAWIFFCIATMQIRDFARVQICTAARAAATSLLLAIAEPEAE